MKAIETWRGRWLRLHPLAAGIDPRIRAAWVVKRTTISNTCRYCYFRIPKCANSTVIKTLARNDPSFPIVGDADDVRRLKSRSGNLFRARAWSVKNLVENYYCFTIVRNPYARLLSAYLDKIHAANPGQYAYVTKSCGMSDIREVTFHQFVEFLENGGLFANPHWAPQHALVPVGIDGLAFIGRVENLDNDLKQVVENGIGSMNYSGLQSREDRRRGAYERIFDYCTDELAIRIHHLYEKDFEIFGYSKELGKALRLD